MIKKGFTLIELLIGIAIMATAFSMVSAQFRDFSRNQAVVSVARELKSDLRLAQEQSLAGKKPSGIGCDSPKVLDHYLFSTNSTTYRIDAVCSSPVTMVRIKEVTLPDGILISAGAVSFKVLGQGTDLEAGTESVFTVTQEATGNSTTVSISAAGEIY